MQGSVTPQLEKGFHRSGSGQGVPVTDHGNDRTDRHGDLPTTGLFAAVMCCVLRLADTEAISLPAFCLWLRPDPADPRGSPQWRETESACH